MLGIADKINLRVGYLGGDSAGRMNQGKLRSLGSALKDSYQSAKIIKIQDGVEYQCLINPDRVQPDYDNKVISVKHNANFKPGDTFYWNANGTYWLVYLQELTETAYFRGYIRHCEHSLIINDVEYYLYVKGPSESSSSWSQSENISYNKLNHSLSLYVAKNSDTLDFFKRFATVVLDGQTWKIESTDSISIPGILEVSLLEHFNNPMEDLSITPVIQEIDSSVPRISGPVFVKPYETYNYTATLLSGGTWSVSNARAKINSSTELNAEVAVVSGRSGSFDLIYSRVGLDNILLSITIESL